MATTNAKASTTSSGTTHPALLQFTVGVLLILLATWFADISDDTGNLTAALFSLLWLLWLMNNSGKLKSITP